MLIRAARLDPPADTVPYGFEKRIMARLTARSLESANGLGIAWLWRASVASLLIMICCGAWSLLDPNGPVPLSLELEQAAYAACCDVGGDIW